MIFHGKYYEIYQYARLYATIYKESAKGFSEKVCKLYFSGYGPKIVL